MNVQDKVIVVTGAGGGIGGELVPELLRRGARVAAVDLRNEGLQAIKTRAGEQDDRLSTHACDITDRAAVEALPELVTAVHGRVDRLINCAGIIQPFVKVTDIDYDAIDRVIHVNFYGTLYMTKAFLPHLLHQGEAHLVNDSSTGRFLPVPGQSIYGASKSAVKLMGEGLYAELLDTAVYVTVVFPGATKTDITKNSHVEMPGNAAAQESKYNMLSADKAAELIVNGIEANKLYVYTGTDSRMMNLLYRLAPKFATRSSHGK